MERALLLTHGDLSLWSGGLARHADGRSAERVEAAQDGRAGPDAPDGWLVYRDGDLVLKIGFHAIDYDGMPMDVLDSAVLAAHAARVAPDGEQSAALEALRDRIDELAGLTLDNHGWSSD